MFAVLVLGPPGVGKTTVLTTLHDLLVEDGVEHAVVEVEALAWCYPPLADEPTFRQVQAVRDVYEQAGVVPLVVWGATITSQGYLARLIEVIAADACFVVRLEADPATLRSRIIEREPPGWSGLAQLLDASQVLAASNLVLSTENGSASGVAESIRAARPEMLATEPRAGNQSAAPRWGTFANTGTGEFHVSGGELYARGELYAL